MVKKPNPTRVAVMPALAAKDTAALLESWTRIGEPASVSARLESERSCAAEGVGDVRRYS